MNSHGFAPCYYNISPKVRTFSTTRHGGHSVGNYASFNINEYCGDNATAIRANKKLLAMELGIDEDNIIMPHQTHGTATRVVDNQFMALSQDERHNALDGIDAIMTNLHGVCIGVSTADCIPILLYDEAHDAVCAIHAGWRGTLGRIARKAVEGMCMAYGSDSSTLRAVIGPGISRRNFEVGNEVYDAFESSGFDMDAIAEKQKKWHIDLPLCNRLTLEQLGLPRENIEMSNVCTFECVDDYFSARRLGTASGRIFTAIMLI